MSEVQPFAGHRPRPDLSERVPSPPYDVMSTEEARTLAAGKPESFLHVIRAEIDHLPGTDAHAEAVYATAAANLRQMVERGWLVRDPAPSLYVYRIDAGDHAQNGLVFGASVEEYAEGRIKKHELTRRAKEDDRARHVRVVGANTGPVLLTYRGRDEVDALLAEIRETRAPVADIEVEGGVRHRLWTVASPERIAAIGAAFAPVDALYIADGHHRAASAFRVCQQLRSERPNAPTPAAWEHFLAVAFPDHELKIQGYHRVVRDLAGLSSEAFLDRVRVRFDLRRTDRPEPEHPREFGMFLDGTWYRLVAAREAVGPEDPVLGLDASILQAKLLAPVLGIGDPRADARIDFVGGVRGLGELERRCRSDMRVAFALYPVTVEQLMAVADAGAVMPPKSTWFEPKLRSGLVLRSLDLGPGL